MTRASNVGRGQYSFAINTKTAITIAIPRIPKAHIRSFRERCSATADSTRRRCISNRRRMSDCLSTGALSTRTGLGIN
jgi:hypothetical protein